MKIAIASDHRGGRHTRAARRALEDLGHEVVDVGPSSEESVDYPDYAEAVGDAVVKGEAQLGILLCGSGVGSSIAANKVPGIRAALCHDVFSARQSREDDDANVLCLGPRVIGPSLADDLIRAFLTARFSKAERHQRRLDKVIQLETRLTR